MTHSKETQLDILKLELKKREKIYNSCSRRLEKYQRANQRVFNAVSQDDIDDVILELETERLEIEKITLEIEELTK